jgi:hypothetical protein
MGDLADARLMTGCLVRVPAIAPPQPIFPRMERRRRAERRGKLAEGGLATMCRPLMAQLQAHRDRTRPHRHAGDPGADDGVTDMPFRRIVKRYGAGADGDRDDRQPGDDPRDAAVAAEGGVGPAEEPVSMQLAGCSPTEMAEAAKLNEDRGAAIIDINMGCPVRRS